MRKAVFFTSVATAAIAVSSLPAHAGLLDSLKKKEEPKNEIHAYYGDISPFYGNIDPFYGDISPFYGDINPFYGDISPFWGDISPFWGDINPFYGDIAPFWGDYSQFYGGGSNVPSWYGDIQPFYGDIEAFWGDISAFWQAVGPMWGDIDAFWGDIDPFDPNAPALYEQLQQMLINVNDQSRELWGAAIEAKTGLSYEEGFADPLFAKYGIDLNDPSTFENFDAMDRANFFIDFYDGLMDYTGIDHVDHWMATINWRPSITQDLGGGADAVIGLLDATINNDSDLLDNISLSEGYQTDGNFHGAAVASLLVAAHDGQGVMGIAPDARVVQFNPFDQSGTTNWADVKEGIEELHHRGANVINMSLGMPGYTLNEGWVDVLGDLSLTKLLSDVLLVKAAGNDGITQTQNLTWSLNTNLLDQLIIVGSVSPNKEISFFSNRPGEACVITGFWCSEQNKLKYKFITAPGEMILVSDDDGGLVRVSGTSFAAPLVAGTATLIMDRWPWLKNDPELVADIIFNTAEDLGEPGVDGVYGWGLLDVEAALSPYEFDRLAIYSGWNYMSSYELKRAILTPGVLDFWEEKGIVLSSFEYYNWKDYRDFIIPLSTRVFGEQYGKNRNFSERTQGYLYNRLIDWAKGGAGFQDQRSFTAPITAGGEWNLSMTARPRPIAEEYYTGDVPFHSDLMLSNAEGTLKLRFGTGAATQALMAGKAFGFASDHDPLSGGVNPVFGFASGSGYAGAALQVSEKATFGMAFSQKRDDHTYQDRWTGEILSEEIGLDPYEANAATMSLNYQLSEKVTMNVGYTMLEEETGLLGAQGAGALSLNGGAKTESTTVGFSFDLPADVALGVSATRGYTQETKFEDSIFALTDGGAVSSAYEVAALKTGLIGKNDQLRVTFAQPLHVENGALEMRTRAVIDRETGEIGDMTQYVPLGGQYRPYVAEMLYATPVMDGSAAVSTFTRAETNTRADNAGIVEYSVGANLKISF